MTSCAPKVTATLHAIERYNRRVARVGYDAAKAALTSASIQRAADAGCCSVILPSGHKVVLAGYCVVTVKPKHRDKRRLRRPKTPTTEREHK